MRTFFLVLFWPLVLCYYYLKSKVLRNSPKRALEFLKKNPGPFELPNGSQRYVWLDNICPNEPEVIGTSFQFHLTEEPPPVDLEIPVGRGCSSHVHCSIDRETMIETETRTDQFGRVTIRKTKGDSHPDGSISFSRGLPEVGFSFFLHLSVKENIAALKDFIKTSIHEDEPAVVREKFQDIFNEK